MINGSIREAKLRPEYAELYPAIEPGVMSEEHFEFRGGHRRALTDSEQRTRAADLRRQA